MKILVDEMPISAGACLFSGWSIGAEAYICRFTGFKVSNDCPSYCKFLAKGVVCDAVGSEEGREASDGETV